MIGVCGKEGVLLLKHMIYCVILPDLLGALTEGARRATEVSAPRTGLTPRALRCPGNGESRQVRIQPNPKTDLSGSIERSLPLLY